MIASDVLQANSGVFLIIVCLLADRTLLIMRGISGRQSCEVPDLCSWRH
jgi:hypothetical protein